MYPVSLGRKQVRFPDDRLNLRRFEQGKGVVELLPGDLVPGDALDEFIVHGGLDEHGFLPDELVDGKAEDCGQFGEFADVGHAVAPLPVGDGLVADAELVGEFNLRHVTLLSERTYFLSNFYHVKH